MIASQFMISSRTSPPVAPVHKHVHEQHGVLRHDPYFWLSDKTSEESLAYLRAERAYYDQQVESLAALTEELQAEMVARVAPSTESARWREGAYEYFTRTQPGLEYDQFLRIDESGAETLLLDENALLGDSTYVAVGLRLVSPDSRLLAYSVDVEGDEVYALRVRDLSTGEDLPGEVPRTYYGGAWSADSSTFFYVVHDELYRPFQVWRHVVAGDEPDTLVYQDLDASYDLTLWADRAGELIVIRTANSTTSEVWLVDARSPAAPARLVAERRQGVEYSVGHLPGPAGGSLLIVTNDGAQEFRLMRAPMGDWTQWQEVVTEIKGERIHDVEVFANYIVLTTVRDSRQWLRLLPWSALDEPDPLSRSVTVDAGVPGGLVTLGHNEEFDVESILVEVESYVVPRTWQTIELSSGQRVQIKQHPVPNYDPDQYVSEERWVTARDGEQVPIRLVRHVDTVLDGSAPLCLYGYGAYESSFWPGFEIALSSLLDRGVVFVHAGIRGGAEMGRRWWLDGRMLHKLNTFTDFIDVADSLATDGLIDGSRIVSRGLSAGGLLQGAVYSMRPDRWRAVVAEVPFVDVITTMFDLGLPLSAGELDEWGDPRRRDDFDYMMSYSPYENVPTTGRPDLLTTGALHDPRVMVHEPAKWVARLRATDNESNGRTLFRAEIGEGGHSGPIGRYSQLGYEAEVTAFILDAVSG